MDTQDTPKKQPEQKNPSEKFGEDVAFGVEQTLACFATDFIDPVVGEKFQKWAEPGIADAMETAQTSHGGKSERFYAWAGEISGDMAALFTFLGVQKFLPQVSVGMTRGIRTMLAPLYNFLGRRSLRQWAHQHHLEETSPQYQARLEEWKEYQANSLAKASIVSAGSVVLNVGTQKIMGNKHSLKVITAAKLMGAAITIAATSLLRGLIPRTMRQMDEELSNRYFAPVVNWSQRLFGMKPKKHEEKEALPAQVQLRGNDSKIDLSEQESAALQAPVVKHEEANRRRREERADERTRT